MCSGCSLLVQRGLLFFVEKEEHFLGALPQELDSLFVENLHNLTASLGNGGARTEDGGNTCFVEEVVVLCWDDTTSDDEDVFTAELLQLFNHLWHEGLVTCGER